MSMKKAEELLVLKYALEMHRELSVSGVYLVCMLSAKVIPLS